MVCAVHRSGIMQLVFECTGDCDGLLLKNVHLDDTRSPGVRSQFSSRDQQRYVAVTYTVVLMK